ncbi:release factor glutamine methyltransferase [Dysgonomonas sp. PH5-45]|uniref:peptide chain release factor N(5)-glutamine methyltransferase n=1 Tax=unclassified Dysgonomonas TaxID=2630389 RepID=UPI002476FD80|nr:MULTISPECIES: peptide chain release factor N(5)-glutamine methyltransferase [unclassified Dysgonomonas]MDH6354158.1 release factor glutamine methyltransferase [Dysgonomonas sp. PH5-45]MDH6386991.1 release factor glutamine methyltransferase [Dysgonomonas sp. PH5-37]
MTETFKYIKNSLLGFYPETEAGYLTRYIIEYITQKPYPVALGDKNTKITPAQLQKTEEIVGRLKLYEPIQYVLGQAEFYGMPFAVNKDVLIPRPETEELVELICIENKTQGLTVLDIGTGSGCIAVALAKKMTNPKVEAWDVLAKALNIARNNAVRNKAEVHFREVDVLKDIDSDKKFDIIVSNPPYVLESDKRTMERNVLEHEPHLALFVPDNDALMFYERIADVGHNLLKPDGRLYFEIHFLKGREVAEMLKERKYSDINLHKDMSGQDRMVSAVLKQKG